MKGNKKQSKNSSKNSEKIIFKKIKGYENYLAGSNGRIYTGDKFGCVKQLTLFLSPNSDCLRVYLSRNGVKENHFVHNVVGCAFEGIEPGIKNFFHKDGNHLNNCPENLSANAEHSVRFVKSKIDEYRLEELESELKSKFGQSDNETWEKYYRIKSSSSARNAMNWLKIQFGTK